MYGYDRIVPKETGDKVRAGVNHPRWNLTHGATKTGTYLYRFLVVAGKKESSYPPSIDLMVWKQRGKVMRIWLHPWKGTGGYERSYECDTMKYDKNM